MKKLIAFLFSVIVLTSCGPTETKDGKPADIVMTGSSTYSSVSSIDYYVSGMRYKVLNSAPGNIFVINITKDSLEVANLKKQLSHE